MDVLKHPPGVTVISTYFKYEKICFLTTFRLSYMNRFAYIFLPLFLSFWEFGFSQTSPFRENSKWGIKEGNQIIIAPVYDTIFNFDSTGSVCIACYQTQAASSNKFIKITSTVYNCNYLNKKNERLVIRNTLNDTFSVFPWNKSVLKHYSGNQPVFTVSAKGSKHLLYKNFEQITFKGYHDIRISEDPKFYYTSLMNEADIVLAGLTNTREEEIIPHQYSQIKLNTKDSVIIACSAGVRKNGEDEVFDYKGKKIIGSIRHIDLATKNFLIHKIFEPKEYYIIYNLSTKDEVKLLADEVKLYEQDEILICLKKNWYIYDLNTNEKKPFKPS